MFAGFVTRPGPDDVMGEDSAQKDADGAALIGLQPGTMQLLLPGEDIKFSDPADVGGSYEAFQYRTLLACCAAMGVPYTNVTGDLRQANYSSLREGKLEFRRRIEQLQHSTVIFQLCRPVWQPQVTPTGTSADATAASAPSQPAAVLASEPAAAQASTPRPGAAKAAGLIEPPPPAGAQVIDLDAVRADERRATLAYVNEVHELWALAGRGDLAAGFITRAAPVARCAGPCSRPEPRRTRPPPSAARCGRARSSPPSLRSTLRRSTPPATRTSDRRAVRSRAAISSSSMSQAFVIQGKPERRDPGRWG
jgi:hypothetical protein